MTDPGRTSLPRRRVLDILLGGGIFAFAASLVYPVFRFLVPTKLAGANVGNVRVAKTSDLKPNTGKLFRFGSGAVLVLRTPSGELRAFDPTCTHLGCNVQYRPDKEEIWCACHNGYYDLFGRNIAGPPPRPLVAYDVTVRGEDIYVSRRA